MQEVTESTGVHVCLHAHPPFDSNSPVEWGKWCRKLSETRVEEEDITRLGKIDTRRTEILQFLDGREDGCTCITGSIFGVQGVVLKPAVISVIFQPYADDLHRFEDDNRGLPRSESVPHRHVRTGQRGTNTLMHQTANKQTSVAIVIAVIRR